MIWNQRNVGAQLTCKRAILQTAVTAGGGADGTEIDGVAVQRVVSGDPALSCVLAIPWNAALASAVTLTIAANLQTGPGSTGPWTDLPVGQGSTAVNAYSGVVATGTSAASPFEGCVQLDADLSMADEYIRAQVTPTLSSTDTDTANVAGVLVLGGFGDLPKS